MDFAIKYDKDYCSNTLVENFPDGQDVEILSLVLLFYLGKMHFEFRKRTCNSLY